MTQEHGIDSDVASQVRAVRGAVGVADLSNRGRLVITGRDRAPWLHGMVSRAVEGLEPGQGNYGTILTDRGKMIADYRLVVRENDLLLDLEPGMQELVAARLERYIISEDAEISSAGDTWSMLGVFGPQAADVTAAVFDVDMAGLDLDCGVSTVFAGQGPEELLLVRTNRIGRVDDAGYDVWLPQSQHEAVNKALIEAGAAAVSPEALEILRIEAGIPRYGVDMDEDIIPIEARLDHAIDYEKGCYVGQEIVARMHYRGHPNKLLVGLRFDGEDLPDPKTDVFPADGSEKRVGWVTSATYSPSLDAGIGLGYVRTNVAEPGTQLALRRGDGTSSLAVSETPFA